MMAHGAPRCGLHRSAGAARLLAWVFAACWTSAGSLTVDSGESIGQALVASNSLLLGSALAQSRAVPLEDEEPALSVRPPPAEREAQPPVKGPYPVGDLPAGAPADPLSADELTDEYVKGLEKDLDDSFKDNDAETAPLGYDRSEQPELDLSPWEKILTASNTALKSLDTPGKLGVALGAPSDDFMGKMGGVTASIKSKTVVPYDMKLGAHIMSALSEKRPPRSLPRQSDIDSKVNTQCPMAILAGSLAVSAPRCGDKHGQWHYPGSDRVIMRWSENALGGVTLKVDSAVEGNGSVLFADVREKFTWDSSKFMVTNCLGLPMYQIEEYIIRMNKMSKNSQSTAFDQGASLRSGEAFFYKYVIRSMNGTNIASTQLLKPATSKVNISLFDPETEEFGTDVVATGTRRGLWEQRQWTECTNEAREWLITYPILNQSTKAALATVQDLRVAAAATITLMAYRQEYIGENGIPNTGKWRFYWSFGKSVVLICAFIFATFWIWTVSFQASAFNKKIQETFVRLENALLPKYSPQKRLSVLHATWD